MEEAPRSDVSITMSLQEIKLHRFEVLQKPPVDEIEQSKLTFEFSINVRVEPDTRQVIISSIIKIYHDVTKTVYLGLIETSGSFEIVNFSEIADNNAIPTQALALLTGVLISTSRGVLLMKAEGTIIEGALLPITDSWAFFRNNNLTTN